MATAVANPPKSFISAEEWEEKKVRSDDYAIAWGREEVPDLDAAAKASVAKMATAPLAAIEEMEKLTDHVQYGLAYKKAIGDLGVIPPLVKLLSDENEETALKACMMLYKISRTHAKEIYEAGCVTRLVAMFKAHPDVTDPMMGGWPSGLLCRVSCAGTEALSAINDADGMDALVCMYRQYKINGDTDDDIPALRQRRAFIDEIEKWKSGM